jgi:hypothetical protein
MFDQLAKALKEKKAMSEKKQPLSHIGGQVEPGTNELNIDEVDLRKRYPKWEDGYERAEIQPSFPKTPSDGQSKG